jgi:hypothetical protein
MQIAMFIVLLSTLGLAALVGRNRDKAIAVELTAKPHLTPRLAIRLPKGWFVEQEGDELPIKVTARESVDPPLKEARGVVVYQTVSTPPGTAEELLSTYLNNLSGEAVSVRPYNIFGHLGVLVRFELAVPNDRLDRITLVPAWYAAGLVPGAGPNGADLGVIIGVQGYRTAGPAGSRLIRQIGDGLRLRGE